jgi:hypothetical protein
LAIEKLEDASSTGIAPRSRLDEQAADWRLFGTRGRITTAARAARIQAGPKSPSVVEEVVNSERQWGDVVWRPSHD